ncbi:MAG: hypothetical protein DRP76_00915 [Candidatus Omnitrophota bacterium]|nr:MAG: hypothetical protein DRP76_00915 [Candidatus Omnitrophota bacterium]
MRVSLDSIKEIPLLLEEDIEAKDWDMDGLDVQFVDKIHLCCAFSRAGKEILVKVEAKTHQLIICSRCLAEVGREVTYEFDLFYNRADLGEYLVVDEDIRQEILLNFPFKVLCQDNCKGLCSRCGANLNYEKCSCGKLKKGEENGSS